MQKSRKLVFFTFSKFVSVSFCISFCRCIPKLLWRAVVLGNAILLAFNFSGGTRSWESQLAGEGGLFKGRGFLLSTWKCGQNRSTKSQSLYFTYVHQWDSREHAQNHLISLHLTFASFGILLLKHYSWRQLARPPAVSSLRSLASLEVGSKTAATNSLVGRIEATASNGLKWGPWSLKRMKKWSSYKLGKITIFAIFGLGWPRRPDLRSPQSRGRWATSAYMRQIPVENKGTANINVDFGINRWFKMSLACFCSCFCRSEPKSRVCLLLYAKVSRVDGE